MARTRTLLQQILQSGLAMSRRAVSTSPRNEQGIATSLNLDSTSTCPFKKTLDTLNDMMNPQGGLAKSSTKVKPFDTIPGPKGLPLVGTLFDYFKKDGPKFSKMFEVFRDRQLQYGDIYYEKVGTFHSVVISSPQVYNQLLHAEGKYPNRREMMPLAYYRQLKGFGLGLVNSQGEEWYKHRSVGSKKMLKLEEVSSFSQEMASVSDDFVTHLGSVRDHMGEVPALEKELFKWAMESIGTFIFEERIGCLGKAPSTLAQSFMDNLQGFFMTLQPLMYNLPIYKMWPTKTWRQFEKYADNVMSIGQYLVEKKMAAMQGHKSESKSAFLSYLLQSGSMSSKEVSGLVIDLLMAAVETTSTATIWCLYNLAQNPQSQDRLYQELCLAGPVSAEQLSKLPYVRAVVKETLRLQPITYATSRNMTEDIELAGYHIPAGTHVQANLYGMYHNPALFPEPDKFVPERWLKDSSSNKMSPTVKAMAQLIWGHGARMCIGRRVAEQEMYITLSKIIQHFRLSYHHDAVQPILHTMLTPDRPVLIRFTPRQHETCS